MKNIALLVAILVVMGSPVPASASATYFTVDSVAWGFYQSGTTTANSTFLSTYFKSITLNTPIPGFSLEVDETSNWDLFNVTTKRDNQITSSGQADFWARFDFSTPSGTSTTTVTAGVENRFGSGRSDRNAPDYIYFSGGSSDMEWDDGGKLRISLSSLTLSPSWGSGGEKTGTIGVTFLYVSAPSIVESIGAGGTNAGGTDPFGGGGGGGGPFVGPDNGIIDDVPEPASLLLFGSGLLGLGILNQRRSARR